MDIHSIRQTLRTRSICDIPLRVTFYDRVSSVSNEQLNFLGNQVSCYEEFIRKNSAWEYAQGYVDERLSAITTKNREDFHRMVEDGNRTSGDRYISGGAISVSKCGAAKAEAVLIQIGLQAFLGQTVKFPG